MMDDGLATLPQQPVGVANSFKGEQQAADEGQTREDSHSAAPPVPLAARSFTGMDLDQENLVEVTTLLDDTAQCSQEVVVSDSQTAVVTRTAVRHGGATSQPAVTTPKEVTQDETGHLGAPQVAVQVVGAPEWGQELEEEEVIDKGQYLEPSITNEYQHHHVPDEEVILLNLEEVEEGIRLVGKPVATPITSTPSNATISVSAAGVLTQEFEETLRQRSSPDRSRSLQVTHNFPTDMKREFDEDADKNSKLLARNDVNLGLLEESAQACLGCCLCHEEFPSRMALHLHVTTIHKQPSTLPHQVNVMSL